MSLFKSVLGIGKLVSNFIGGGSGSSTNQAESGSSNSDLFSEQAQEQATQTQTSTTSDMTGTQSGTEETSGRSAMTGDTTARQVNSQFSDKFLQLLEGSAAAGLARSGVGGTAALGRLSEIAGEAPSFDADKYVSDIMTAANNALGNGAAVNRNKIMAVTGGSTTGNSQAALLANKIQTDNTAQLAGIRGDAAAKAAELARVDRMGKTSEVAQLSAVLDSGMASLLSMLKGGESSSVGTEQSKQIQESSQSSATNISQASRTSSLVNEEGIGKIAGMTRSKENKNATSTSSAEQPFNWGQAIGSIFKDIE